jgi:hypothetical protein
MVPYQMSAGHFPLVYENPTPLYVTFKTRVTKSHIFFQVVFKALIVLHNMIRNGATDNVLAHLSASDVLRLKHVGSGNWEGTYFSS